VNIRSCFGLVRQVQYGVNFQFLDILGIFGDPESEECSPVKFRRILDLIPVNIRVPGGLFLSVFEQECAVRDDSDNITCGAV
jgi:hypothetical protein